MAVQYKYVAVGGNIHPIDGSPRFVTAEEVRDRYKLPPEKTKLIEDFRAYRGFAKKNNLNGVTVVQPQSNGRYDQFN